MFKGELSINDIVDMEFKKLYAIKEARENRLIEETKRMEKETAEAEHWSRLHAAVEQVQSSLGLTAETASEPAPGQEEPADQPLFLLPREPQETAVPQGQEAPESTEEPPILPNEPSDAPDAAEEAPEADPDDTQEEQAEQEPDGVLPPEEEDVPQG